MRFYFGVFNYILKFTHHTKQISEKSNLGIKNFNKININNK